MRSCKSDFLRQIIVVILSSSLSFLFACGGGGGGSSTSTTTVGSSGGEILKISEIDNPDVPFYVVGTSEDAENESVGVVATKESSGNVTDITNIIYSKTGEGSLNLKIGSDGLPESITDSNGNKVSFSNYTSNSVDITIYDSSGALVSRHTAISIDFSKLQSLQTLIQSYKAIAQNYKVYGNSGGINKPTKKELLQAAAMALKILSCGVSIGYGNIPTAARACGSLVLTIADMATDSDIIHDLNEAVGLANCQYAIAIMDPTGLGLASCLVGIAASVTPISNVTGTWIGSGEIVLANGASSSSNCTTVITQTNSITSSSGSTVSETYSETCSNTTVMHTGVVTTGSNTYSGDWSGIAAGNSITITQNSSYCDATITYTYTFTETTAAISSFSGNLCYGYGGTIEPVLVASLTGSYTKQ